jgi:8-oxo-dGTP diphosphatase
MEPIRIAAAVIQDDQGPMLVVRKRGTRFFMQPGGKIREGETGTEALARELQEELGCTLAKAEFLGVYRAVAANEEERVVEAELYKAEIGEEPRVAAEIEEMAWIGREEAAMIVLAPLTREHVVPLILS